MGYTFTVKDNEIHVKDLNNKQNYIRAGLEYIYEDCWEGFLQEHVKIIKIICAIQSALKDVE